MNNNRRSTHYLKTLAGITVAVAAANHLIIQRAQKRLPAQHRDMQAESHFYRWACGNIHYTKTGHGRPVLLIHNVYPCSAGYEWEKVAPIIAGNRTVYTLDLPGCGLSEKKSITYTNFLYMQLVKDFVREVIHERTDVAAIGSSSAFIVGACAGDAALFNKLIFVSPQSPLSTENSKKSFLFLHSLTVRTPVLGTLLYNLEFSRFTLRFKLENLDLANASACTSDLLNLCSYHAHLGAYKAKALFASIVGGYMDLDISKMLKKIDNDILLIVGRDSFFAKDIVNEYRSLKPSIDTKIIHNTKNLIPVENHLAVANAILNYISA